MANTLPRKAHCVLDVCGAGTIVRPAAAADCLRQKLGVVMKSHYLRDGRLQAAPPACMLFAKAGPRKSLVIPTGHLDRAQALLEAQGFHVTVRTVRAYRELSSRLQQWISEARVDRAAQQLLGAVVSRPSGLLCFRGDRAIAEAIGLLCKFFADNRVLIVAHNKRAVSKTAKLLSSGVGDRTCCTWGDLKLAFQPMSVLVLDVQQFGRLAPSPRDFPVVIFADARLALGSSALTGVLNLSRALRFACLRTSDRLCQ